MRAGRQPARTVGDRLGSPARPPSSRSPCSPSPASSRFVFEIRTILLWLLVGLILAVSLEPGVAWLQRHGWNRVLASLVVSIATIALLVGAVIAVAYPLVFQSDRFINDLPRLLDRLFGSGGSLHFLETRFHILRHVSSIRSEDVANLVLGGRAQIMGLFTKAASSVGAIVTMLTMMVMLLIEGPACVAALIGALIGDERRWAEHMGSRTSCARRAGTYAATRPSAWWPGRPAYIVLRILHVPYAETLAVFVAVFDIIPMVGATIAAVVVCIIGLATGGLVDCVVLAVFFIVYQQFENNVLQNLVYGKTLQLSPLVIFIAALVGATLAGIARRSARDPTRRRRLGVGDRPPRFAPRARPAPRRPQTARDPAAARRGPGELTRRERATLPRA